MGKIDILIDLQHGDTGKGMFVDYMAPNYDIIARGNGSSNSGRTIIVNNKKRVLRNLPSGALHESVKCVLGNGMVINPTILLSEIQDLENEGISIKNRVSISTSAHMVLPYHIAADIELDKVNGIGTTGNGVSQAYTDKFSRGGIRFDDINNIEFGINKIKKSFNFWSNTVKNLNNNLLEESINVFKQTKDNFKNNIIDTVEYLNSELDNDKKIMIEMVQGHNLDIDHGSYPYVTSSNTTIGGALTGTGLSHTKINKVYGICKIYTTKVGSGPFDTEMDKYPREIELAKQIAEIGKEYGSVTGRPRRIGFLDLVDLKKAVRLNGVTDLIITKVDTCDGLGPMMACIAKNGVNKEYHVAKIWNNSRAAKSREEIDPALEEFISKIEDFTGVKVKYISTGPERNQIIQ